MDMTTTQPDLFAPVAPKPSKRGTQEWQIIRWFMGMGWSIGLLAVMQSPHSQHFRQRVSDIRKKLGGGCIVCSVHIVDGVRYTTYTVPVEFRDAMAQLAEE